MNQKDKTFSKNYLYLVTAISYFIGAGAGYILKSDNTTIESIIISLFIGLGFATYVVPIILLQKEEK